MGRPWAALPVGADVRAVDRTLRAAREDFLAGGRPDGVVRALVAESWQRCGAPRAAQRAPELDGDRLADHRDGHPLAVAMPVVRRLLGEDAAEGDFVVALADARGRLLWIEGAASARHRAEGFGFVEGADWSERAAGTNAPGTALALDQPVQIFAAEHLAGPAIDWSCSAAPLHGPDGRLLGAVDVTGGHDVAAPHTLTLVRTVAAAVEAELHLQALLSARGQAVPGQPAGVREPARGGTARLRLLGEATGVLVTADGEVPLRLRHAEILLVLALHPEGLTADQLAIELHDRRTAPVTLRAELSRLRDLLARAGGGIGLAGRPYRLVGELGTDVEAVRRDLRRGAYRRALAAYPGPVLPASTAPGVEAVRERLRHELRGCVLAGRDAEALWAWANTPDGADDLEVWQACAGALPATSRRGPVVRARVRQLHQELG